MMEVDVTVRAIAAGGSGVGDLPDGRVVFVPRTAPGDRARIHVDKSKRRWAVGSLRRLLEPAPERREAPCPLYATCGGCQLQHLPYASQLEWKARVVADALERIGGIGLESPPPIVASPHELGYRNRLTFTLRRLRSGGVVAGFHALGRPSRIVDVADQCLLPEPRILEVWQALRSGWGAGAGLLPPGGQLRLTLRRAGEGVALLVEGGGKWRHADHLAGAVPELTSLWHREGGWAAGPKSSEAAPELVAGYAEPPSVRAFEQVNSAAADLLRAHTLALVGVGKTTATAPDGSAPTAAAPDRRGPTAAAPESSGRGAWAAAARPIATPSGEGARIGDPADRPPRGVDAYCGVGAYGRALARAGWSVTGIELDPAAAAAARQEAPDGFRVLEGRTEELLARALPAELLIVNPPRTGLHADLPGTILKEPPARVVYVSCDPATLARDLGALRGVYDVEDVRCFDLFPQTAHVETVVALERTG